MPKVTSHALTTYHSDKFSLLVDVWSIQTVRPVWPRRPVWFGRPKLTILQFSSTLHLLIFIKLQSPHNSTEMKVSQLIISCARQLGGCGRNQTSLSLAEVLKHVDSEKN